MAFLSQVLLLALVRCAYGAKNLAPTTLIGSRPPALLPGMRLGRSDGGFQVMELAVSTGHAWTMRTGALISWTNEIEVNADVAPLRCVFGGTTLFLTTVSVRPLGLGSGNATEPTAKVLVAPAVPGEIISLDAATGWTVAEGAFLAAAEGVTFDLEVQSLMKGLFTASRFVVLTVKVGAGPVMPLHGVCDARLGCAVACQEERGSRALCRKRLSL